MLYLNQSEFAIELREAPEPWGPWSEPIEVLSGWETPPGTFGLYGSYMNPLYVDNGGETIYFTMSLWDPYDVFIVKATLEFVSALPGDFDSDGDVDGADFLYWQLNDGSESNLTVWQENFGAVASPTTSASTGVPEPTAGLMLMLGMASLPIRLAYVGSGRSRQSTARRTLYAP